MKKILAVFALALMMISAHAQTDKNAAEARRIFDEMRAEYSRLETFSHGKIVSVNDGKETVSDVKVAFRQPNRFSEIKHRSEGDWINVSDGRTNYFYDVKQSKTKYFAMPMPPEKLGRVGIMQYYGGGFFLAPFLAGVDPFDAPWDETGLGKAVRSFSLGEPAEVDGVMTDAVVVRFDREDKFERTYFIGQKDRLLHRIESTNQEGAQVHKYSATYSDVRANPEIPDSTFEFVPPPDTQESTPLDIAYEQKRISQDVIVGDFPPPLNGVDLQSKPVDLKDYKGKVVLLDFWATWCGPCIADLPFVQAAYAKYHDQGFETIGISFDENRADLEKFIGEKKMLWPQIFDGKMFKNDTNYNYKVGGIPTTILIGRDGKVAAFEPSKLLLEPAIEKALAAPMPK